MGRQKTWTEEQLIKAVETSASAAGVLRQLGMKQAGGSQAYIRRVIQERNLDTSHFRGQAWNRGVCHSSDELAATLIPLLCKGAKKITRLRDRLIASGLKEAKCEECGITEWCKQPAPLQVDHVDGDRLNNELENLRILCANCHMLTETWGFKNGRRRPLARVA